MGFDERCHVLSGELHCPQGAYHPVLADTLLETGDVLVECVEQSLILAAESLIGVAYHLCRHECLTVCQVLVVLDDLRLDVLAMQASPSSPSGQGLGSTARLPCFAP